MRLHVRDVAAPGGADRPLRALRPDDHLDRPVLAGARARRRRSRSLRGVPDPALPAPFRWEGEHIAADLPGGRVLFSTRRGGVSTGPFASLNLGRLTDDDGANVDENRERLAAAVGLPRERFLYGRQVHGADGAARDRAAGPGAAGGRRRTARRPRCDDAAALVFVADCLPVMLAGRGRRRGAARRLARAGGRDRGRGRRRAARARRGRPADAPRSGPARAAAATRSARRSTPRSPTCPARAPASATSTCPRSPATRLARGRRGDRPRHRPVHDLRGRRRCSSRTGATAASPAARRGSCGGP